MNFHFRNTHLHQNIADQGVHGRCEELLRVAEAPQDDAALREDRK